MQRFTQNLKFQFLHLNGLRNKQRSDVNLTMPGRHNDRVHLNIDRHICYHVQSFRIQCNGYPNDGFLDVPHILLLLFKNVQNIANGKAKAILKIRQTIHITSLHLLGLGLICTGGLVIIPLE